MIILVPYRDRDLHLQQFIPAMSGHDIYIIEQVDKKPFNRGKLINAGFLHIKPEYFVANDVDMIGEPSAYTKKPGINQLTTSNIQIRDYLGGSTMFESQYFPGYHNDYFHRAEDNELAFYFKQRHISVNYWNFKFTFLDHKRPSAEFDPGLWVKAQIPRTKDMLKTCEYKLVSFDFEDGYRHLKVIL